ncbi:arylsulfatase B-like isoform X2 [Paramacrobiotus metropolitanus]|nr:arylsulfatase B-like isoform X2 [Paramacrobiotus metropolitanus]
MCSPSRAALMTGKYPIHTGMQHNVLYAAQPYGLGLEEKLLPQYLKEAGYRNHAIGKWHLGFFHKNYTPTYRGFDTHFGHWTGHIDYFNHTAFEFGELGHDLHDGLNPTRNRSGHYITDIYTKKAEKVIFNHNTSEPMFLYLSHQAVHAGNADDPLQTTERYFARYPNIQNRDRRIFAGMVGALDESVGRVYAALKERKMLDNSIIIFTTDNGGATAGYDRNKASNWPLRGGKDTLFEGGVRATAFLWSPLLLQIPRVSTQMMHITDWLPTLLYAAGIHKYIPGIDGFNMWPTLSHNFPSPRSEILLNIDRQRGLYGLRVRNYKLIKGSTFAGLWDRWYGSKGTFDADTDNDVKIHSARIICQPPTDPSVTQSCRPSSGPCLFDLDEDPCEYRNIAAEQPAVLQRMMKRLAEYNETVVRPRNRPMDQQARPRFHGGVWTTWRE